MNYYEINEDTARRAKQMRSFDDYCEGSATWQYRNRCDEAAALAEQVKAERCKTAAQREHIDYLLNRYCKVLAEATNKDNEIGTRCPSVMISGGGNFPVAKKEKQIAAWEKNAERYGYADSITGCATYAAAYAAMKAAFVEAAEKIGFSVSEEATGEMDDQGQEVKLVVATGLKADDSFFADLTPNVQVEQVTSNLSYETVEYGDISLPLGTITKMVTGVNGMTAVNNAIKYSPGRQAETDSQIRERYAASIAIRGSGTIGRICASLLSDVDGCDYAEGYENPTDATDAEGRPPHSIEIVVRGGDDTAVAETIWTGKAAGIRSYGQHYAYINDSQGVQQYVQFSRIENCVLHLQIALEVDSENLDNNYVEKITSILTTLELQAGEDVKMQQTLIPAIMQGVNGITYVDMKGMLDDLDGGSSGTYKHGTIKVGLRQQPVITNDSIEVTVSG